MSCTFVDAAVSYLATFIVPPPSASEIDEYMGTGFTETVGDVAEALEACLVDNPELITDNFKSVSFELDQLDIESVENGKKGSATPCSPMATRPKPETAHPLLTVELLMSFQQTFRLPRVTKSEVVDADYEWDSSDPEGSIQAFLESNWDDYSGSAELIVSEFSDVEFQDVSGFDPATVGEKKLFTVKCTCTALRDYEGGGGLGPVKQIKAGDSWINLHDGSRWREEGDPYLDFAGGGSRLEMKRLIEQEQIEARLNDSVRKQRGEAPFVSVTYELIPSQELIRFERQAAEVG